MFESDDIKALWSKTKPKVWEGCYWMVSCSLDEKDLVASIFSEALAGDSYHSIIRDQHETVFVVCESIWGNYRAKKKHQAEYGPLSLLTLDVPLDIEVSGYLAPMVADMADRGISIVPQCSLIYDHVLVNTKDINSAISIVESIQIRALS